MNTFATAFKNLEYIEQVVPEEIIIEKSAFQFPLEREVLVRSLSPSAADNPKLRVTFLKEMRTLASSSHPNLAHVYDAGLEDDIPYVVLEKPDGFTLSRRLDILKGQRSRMDVGEAARIVLDMAEAVAYANQRSIHLQSMTPDNIVLTTAGRAVLTGFGHPIPENVLTASTSMLAYAPPERIHGGQVDNRSDVYSLGVLLYHLLFGRLPFEGDAWGIILQKRTADSLPALGDPHIHQRCPRPLVDVMRKATAQQLDHRYDDADSFRQALSEALETMQVRSAPNGHTSSNGTNGTAHPGTTNGSGVNGFKKANGSSAHNGHEVLGYEPIWSQNGHKNGHNSTATQSKPAAKSNGIKVIDIDEQFLEVDHPSVLNSQEVPAPANVGLVESEIEEGPVAYVNQPEAGLQTEIDPLMPGLENPELQAALPYTILVPMPEVSEESEADADPSAVSAEANSSINYAWFVGMGLLGAMSVVAAMQLG